MRFLRLSTATFFLLFGLPAHATWPEGNWYWPTKFGRDVLKFETDHFLVYQSFHAVDDKKKVYSLFGTWQYQPGPCKSGIKQETNKASSADGSLVLQFHSTQCCLNASTQGNSLVLAKAWLKGSSLAVHDYCSDNILMPFESSDN